MHHFFFILVITAGLISAEEQEVPLAQFITHCSKIGIYRFDKNEDAWILRNKLKGTPPKIAGRWDPKLYGPRPRPEPNGKGYYILDFEFAQHNHLGQVKETYGVSLGNTLSGFRPVFEIENLPKWVLAQLKIHIDGGKLVVPLPEDLVIKEEVKEGEQASAGQPATRSQSKSEGGDKPQPESEERSR